ncbi:T9SS type A sorting domain-containing protein [Hymenobacter sp. BT664]|uniref:T9SS type A sorting domain-containing protein n=1 Tax=Hymenobacter montanus TaxID=2771359 RepID=A0A927GIA7_9BACT|nr:T9SS type A sorting domain-containing protein [Hymenobacter montanus]MBD2767202.1 T9SS type A sorting domain-containing protein [Hymenobacter montanus]
MVNSYVLRTLPRRLRHVGLAALLVGSSAVLVQAQALNYITTGATNVVTTYTDLTTTGTAIATANTDDANSAAQPIGFTFNYNGATFTQFVLNTNGFIKLGNLAPSSTAMFLSETPGTPSTDPFQSADANIIAPFNIDLTAGAAGNTEYRVATTGASGSRICTIQWKNVRDKASVNPTQYTNMSFQVRLYEGTNVIELVYGPATASASATFRSTQVGLKGTSFADGQILQAKKQPTDPWSAATFASVLTAGSLNTLNASAASPPTAGRTFRFTPIPPIPNDVAVQAVYTLGKIASPGALPQAVRAIIANVGTATQNSVVVTLSITGANTFTNIQNLAILPAGARGTINFANLPATLNAGTNTVTVSVAADGNNTNNSVTVSQLVTTNRISYIEPALPNDGPAVYYSNASAGGVLSVKYTVPSLLVLTDAVVTFAAVPSNPTTAFQVIVYDATGAGGVPGNVLYTSPTQNRPAAGGPVTITLPNVQVNGPFHVGVKEVGTTGAFIASQRETPLRNAIFYSSSNGLAPWSDLALSPTQSRLAIELGLSSVPNCTAPTNLGITGSTTTTATATFTVSSNTSSQELIYGPAGFDPTTGGTTVTAPASPFTITGLQPNTSYQAYIRAACTNGGTTLPAGPVTFSTSCDPLTSPISSFPYSEDFDNVPTGPSLPCGMSILNANGDAATWALTTSTPFSGPRAIRYNGATVSDVAADDWLFTPPLVLTADNRYQVAFRYRAEGIAGSPSPFTERLEVRSGTSATVAGQTNLLYTNTAITNTTYALANGASLPVVALLPAGASTQYVSFHVNSAANQGALYLDNIAVTAILGAANSEALLRAVSVFPNPSATGVFDLEIHGANAKGGLEVLVSNALGQRVHTGSARDNFTNPLDLSRLPAGLYTLRLRNGAETMTSRLSIVK